MCMANGDGVETASQWYIYFRFRFRLRVCSNTTYGAYEKTITVTRQMVKKKDRAKDLKENDVMLSQDKIKRSISSKASDHFAV